MACGNKVNEPTDKLTTKFAGLRHDPNLDQQIQPLLNLYFAVMANLQEKDSVNLQSYGTNMIFIADSLTQESLSLDTATQLKAVQGLINIQYEMTAILMESNPDARIMGADCVLLIAAALSQEELARCMEVARFVDIDVLVEVHDEAELDRALQVDATIIGVNQRDLVTFAVDHDRAVRMGSLMPSHVVRVAESGVRGRDDALSLRSAGYDAVLVGEHLVTSSDPAAALTDLCVE